MSFIETLHLLARWTPFMAGGFFWNMIVSLAAMSIGTAFGTWLAWLQAAPHKGVARICEGVVEIMRCTPTVVCQFYLAFILPTEITLPGIDVVIPFPAWIKAALALSIAVAAFVSDNLGPLLYCEAPCPRTRQRLLTFLPNWSTYFVVIIIASSSASVIGVDELVSRCNSVVNAVGRTQFMLWVYLYAMLWFFLFCYGMNRAIKLLGSVADTDVETETVQFGR
jgi:polar amino acid transport system permease protein